MQNEDLGKKGERQAEENYIKNGEKGLKNAYFGVLNSNRGKIFRPPLPSVKLICHGKN